MGNISIFSIEGVDAREICNAQLGDALFAPCSVCDKWKEDFPSVDSFRHTPSKGNTMKKIYSAPARYIFEGTFKVEAERSEEAKCYAKS